MTKQLCKYCPTFPIGAIERSISFFPNPGCLQFCMLFNFFILSQRILGVYLRSCPKQNLSCLRSFSVPLLKFWIGLDPRISFWLSLITLFFLLESIGKAYRIYWKDSVRWIKSLTYLSTYHFLVEGVTIHHEILIIFSGIFS